MLTAVMPLAASAQFGLPGVKQVTWSAAFVPGKAAPGQTATLVLAADIAEDWHIYGQELENKGPVPTSFEVQWPEGWTPVGDWTPETPPRKAIDPGFQFEVTYHEGKARFHHRVRVPEGRSLGTVEVSGRVRSQACDATQCLPPMWNPWTATLEVVDAAVAPAQATPIPARTSESTTPRSETETSDESVESDHLDQPNPAGETETAGSLTGEAERLEEAEEAAAGENPAMEAAGLPTLRQEGLWAFLAFAVVAGLASLLTPCVFPMIPITVSFFTKRSDRTPRQGVLLALIYAGGIVVTFSLLGLSLSAALGLFKGVSGAGAANWIAANPWINLVLGALFVFFALSLFGLFDIQLPSGLANTLQRAGTGRADVLGALIMAVVFTVTSFTCTVQFVGWLLVEAARGSWLWPGIGMVVYSAAFASPFFVLALFPQALARLPRSGPWLHSTKVVMGFLELAAAFKFLSNSDVVWKWGFLNRELVLAVWTAIAFFTGLYLLGMIRMKSEPGGTKEIGTLRMLLSMVFVSLGFYLASGLVGTRLHGLVETYLPPRIPGQATAVASGFAGPGSTTGGAGEAGHLPWIDDYDAGLALAKKENRPVFIDFTGVTCTNCRWMEINIFSRPDVQALLKRFVLLQLYTDTADPEAERYQKLQAEKFGTVALPYYVILRPDGSVVDTHGGLMRDPKRFARFLQQGLDEKEELQISNSE